MVIDMSDIEEIKKDLHKIKSQKKRQIYLESIDSSEYTQQEKERYLKLVEKSHQKYSVLKLLVWMGFIMYVFSWIYMLLNFSWIMQEHQFDNPAILAKSLLLMFCSIWSMAGVPIEIILVIALIIRSRSAKYYLNIKGI